jgi:hypothetical protein
VNPRLLLVVVPLLVVITGVFAGQQLSFALVYARRGDWPFAAFYTLFGVAGIAMAVALGRMWLQRRRAARQR